ncbi:MAG: TetR/AcrR family transcriptional regulator [Actinomycetota bacterium]|nr:TetR/AcrR family transcriptional regulator [Actinomycetota bacterium]
MSDARLERILDAAYACFARHGVRRTTMDDIAVAAEMSRAAVYQHVQNKDDAFRRLTSRIFDGALAQAQAAAASDAPLAERLHGVLAVKLELVLQLMADSPHAEELLGTGSRLTADLYDNYDRDMRELAAAVIADARDRGEVKLLDIEPVEVAELGIALTKGLEGDLADPETTRRRLRQGIGLFAAGLTAASPATSSA